MMTELGLLFKNQLPSVPTLVRDLTARSSASSAADVFGPAFRMMRLGCFEDVSPLAQNLFCFARIELHRSDITQGAVAMSAVPMAEGLESLSAWQGPNSDTE